MPKGGYRPGSGRKPLGKKTRVKENIMIAPETSKKLKALSKKHKKPKGRIIDRLVEDAE